MDVVYNYLKVVNAIVVDDETRHYLLGLKNACSMNLGHLVCLLVCYEHSHFYQDVMIQFIDRFFFFMLLLVFFYNKSSYWFSTKVIPSMMT